MFAILDRIFCIPEVEELIFEYLDPVLDLKNIAAISHHYHNLIEYNKEYTEIRNFCRSQKYCNLTTFVNACKQGNIYAVKYVYQKKNIPHEEYMRGFRYSCYNDHLKIVEWLYNLLGQLKPSLDLTDLQDRCLNNKYVFEICCENGHFQMIIWLYNLSGFFDTNIDYDLSFAESCYMNHLEVAQWLYNLSDPIDIHVKNDSIFKLSCQNNHLEMALWLTTICDKYQLTISDDKIISHVP